MADEPTRDTRDAFNMFDTDGDGVINQTDLKVALNTLGFEFTDPEIERFIAEMDPDGSGVISFPNFSELIHSQMSQRETVGQLQEAFDLLDDDHTGKISFNNLKSIAQELGETLTDQELKEMISEADTDNDGEISFDEFVALIRTASFS
jgi:centrin-1